MRVQRSCSVGISFAIGLVFSLVSLVSFPGFSFPIFPYRFPLRHLFPRCVFLYYTIDLSVFPSQLFISQNFSIIGVPLQKLYSYSKQNKLYSSLRSITPQHQLEIPRVLTTCVCRAASSIILTTCVSSRYPLINGYWPTRRLVAHRVDLQM